MLKHFNINVYGKVQGVFFRASAKAKADDLGVNGFVQNKDDGSVYIEAEGEEEALANFVLWCERGPERAHVSRCTIKEAEVKGIKGFAIKR